MAQISLVERNLEECAAGQAGELHETEAFLGGFWSVGGVLQRKHL